MEVTNKYKINITIENTVQNYYTTQMTTEKVTIIRKLTLQNEAPRAHIHITCYTPEQNGTTRSTITQE